MKKNRKANDTEIVLTDIGAIISKDYTIESDILSSKLGIDKSKICNCDKYLIVDIGNLYKIYTTNLELVENIDKKTQDVWKYMTLKFANRLLNDRSHKEKYKNIVCVRGRLIDVEKEKEIIRKGKYSIGALSICGKYAIDTFHGSVIDLDKLEIVFVPDKSIYCYASYKNKIILGASKVTETSKGLLVEKGSGYYSIVESIKNDINTLESLRYKKLDADITLQSGRLIKLGDNYYTMPFNDNSDRYNGYTLYEKIPVEVLDKMVKRGIKLITESMIKNGLYLDVSKYTKINYDVLLDEKTNIITRIDKNYQLSYLQYYKDIKCDEHIVKIYHNEKEKLYIVDNKYCSFTQEVELERIDFKHSLTETLFINSDDTKVLKLTIAREYNWLEIDEGKWIIRDREELFVIDKDTLIVDRYTIKDKQIKEVGNKVYIINCTSSYATLDINGNTYVYTRVAKLSEFEIFKIHDNGMLVQEIELKHVVTPELTFDSKNLLESLYYIGGDWLVVPRRYFGAYKLSELEKLYDTELKNYVNNLIEVYEKTRHNI